MMGQTDTAATSVLDKRLQTASIVVAALAMSVLLFAVAGTFVAPRAGDTPPSLSFGLVAVSFFLMLASVFARRVMFTPAKLTEVYEKGGEAALGDYVFRVTIVSSALAEGVGAIGLVLGLVTGDTYYMYALCFIALLGVLSNFPRARRWRDLSADLSARTRAGASPSGFGVGS
jgi:hypothetical protein